MCKTKISSTVHNLLGCVVLSLQDRSVAIKALPKQLEVRQKEIVKLMVQLIPINFSGSKIRAQNIGRKLMQGSTPPLPPLSARPERAITILWLISNTQ